MANYEAALHGPGIWFSVHWLALNALSQHDCLATCNYIRMLARVFPCSICSSEVRTYVEEFPPEHTIRKVGDQQFNEEAFRYTVDLHNLVNSCRNAATMSHQEALKLYLDSAGSGCLVP